MNAYTVTFYRENADEAEDVKIYDVEIRSAVDPADVAAGDWDAHEQLTESARRQAHLDGLWGTSEDGVWQASHVTLPDGETAMVPAGL